MDSVCLGIRQSIIFYSNMNVEPTADDTKKKTKMFNLCLIFPTIKTFHINIYLLYEFVANIFFASFFGLVPFKDNDKSTQKEQKTFYLLLS